MPTPTPTETEPTPSGVVFAPDDKGRRSTTAFGRGVVADALRATDPVGARAAESEAAWRTRYLTHLRRLVEAGLPKPDDARSIAAAGLSSVHERLHYARDGGETPLVALFDEADAMFGVRTETRRGTGEPERELSLPYRGDRLRGDALRRRLDAWEREGILEPGCTRAVHAVLDHPDWLELSDQRVVVLGAGAEMGPLQSLLRWGGDIVALDLPRPGLWKGLLERTRELAGTLHVPVTGDAAGDNLAEQAGLDLVHDLPSALGWLGSMDGPLVLGNYVYADGSANVQVCAAADALSARLVEQQPQTRLAFLATPTDVFAVPAEAVAQSVRAYAARPKRTAALRGPLRLVSGGKLLARQYLPGADPGVHDAMVAQQGPNYSLAKRLQRWRATTARAAGTGVSLNVAPPTRTRSVLKNRALAAAYAGAHRFDIEVFEPATSNTLMAAMLVHDLREPVPAQEHPWQDEAAQAAHGGLWRAPYDTRSALGLAMLLGFGSART